MFTPAQTEDPTSPDHQLDELADALASLHLDVRIEDNELVVDGSRLMIHVAERSHPSPADLARLLADPGALPHPRAMGIVVADRISEAGRKVLRDAGWGWLDRRGHVRVWTSGLRLEAPTSPGEAPPRSTNLWTTVGLEVALWALCHPEHPVTARRVAPKIGRSVGAAHDMIQRFTDAGLIGRATHRPLLPELFWETAARWPDDGWLGLPLELAAVSERLGVPTLIRVDERAATIGGANIAAAGELPARAYVVGPAVIRRARALANRDEPTRSHLRLAPVTWMPVNEELTPDNDHPWRIAHPMVCALRLAADPARGREIVENWGIVPESAP